MLDIRDEEPSEVRFVPNGSVWEARTDENPTPTPAGLKWRRCDGVIWREGTARCYSEAHVDRRDWSTQAERVAVVAEAAAGETVTITDRGRPVAQLTAIPASRLRSLIDSGRPRVRRSDITEIPAPDSGPALTAALSEMRDAERY